MYARHMVWDAVKFAFRKFFSFWLGVLPRILITVVATAAISFLIVFGLYYLARMLKLIPAGWMEFDFILALALAAVVPLFSLSIVWLRVALGKAMDRPVPYWVTPIIRPTIKMFLASIMTAICATLGLILLIVPGIFISLRLCMANFCIIDHEHGPIRSLKCSWGMTRDAKSDIWKLSFILFAFILILMGVRLWMGLPIQNYTQVAATVSELAKGTMIKIDWWQAVYNVGAMLFASLVTLFMAHLYTQLSRKQA